MISLALRKTHFADILARRPDLPFFEVLIENYLHADSPMLRQLSEIRQHYPLFAHGTGLSIGSVDPLNLSYLACVKTFLERFNIDTYSDHLAFVSFDGDYLPELLPLPYHQSTLIHVAERVDAVQHILKRPLILENISSYFVPTHEMSEAAFLTALCEMSGCKILLDINNIYVSCHNHGWPVADYFNALKAEHIAAYHLAGHENENALLIDTHGHAISEAVWSLFASAVQRFGVRPTVIERDHHLPVLDVLLTEVERGRALCLY